MLRHVGRRQEVVHESSQVHLARCQPSEAAKSSLVFAKLGQGTLQNIWPVPSPGYSFDTQQLLTLLADSRYPKSGTTEHGSPVDIARAWLL